MFTLLTDYNGSGELMTLVEGHAIDCFRQHNQEVIRISGISHTDATIFTEVGRRKVSIGTLALSEKDGLAKLELFKKWYEHEAIRRLREEAVAQGILKHKWGTPIGMRK